MRLSIESLSAGYRDKDVLTDFSLCLESGEALCLLGANGCGKTTLLKTILGLLPLRKGRLCLNGEDIGNWTPRKRASFFGYVPQEHTPPFAYKVRDVILMARSVHLKLFSSPGKHDLAIVERSLDQLQISALAEANYTEISGGERQLVLIARALAQEPRFLILDEPTANLDFGNQVRVLQTIRQLRSSGLGLLMTTHMPDHAFLCGSQAALIHKGRLIATGAPQSVLTEAQLTYTYGVPLKVLAIDSGFPIVLPVFQEKE